MDRGRFGTEVDDQFGCPVGDDRRSTVVGVLAHGDTQSEGGHTGGPELYVVGRKSWDGERGDDGNRNQLDDVGDDSV